MELMQPYEIPTYAKILIPLISILGILIGIFSPFYWISETKRHREKFIKENKFIEKYNKGVLLINEQQKQIEENERKINQTRL